jgi:carbon monoxide dehydrogenase subunit G
MPTFEHTIEIDAPIEYVYEFGIDPENWQRTMPSLTAIENIEETDDGLRMDLTYKLLGISLDGEMQFTIVEPHEHTVSAFQSPGMTGELHYHFSETDSGTEVVQQVDYEFGDSLLQRVVEPVAKRYNKRQFENALRTTKELVEAEATVTA